MADNWEDWEDLNPILIKSTPEQLKILEDRKLVQESDAEIVKDLFNKREQNVFELNRNRNRNRNIKNKSVKTVNNKEKMK